MKRGIHELSQYEKRDVADELMLPTGVFGAVLIAGLLCLALVWQPLWQPRALFDRVVHPAAESHLAMASAKSGTLRVPRRQPSRAPATMHD